MQPARVIELSRARQERMKHPTRLALGTLCTVLDVDGDPNCMRSVVATVVGTWAFTGASGMPGTVETRARRVNVDPRSDEAAQGYLLMPSDGGGFLLFPFGAVSLGEIIPIT